MFADRRFGATSSRRSPSSQGRLLAAAERRGRPCGSGTSSEPAADRPAAAPAALRGRGWPSAPTARSSRSRSATTTPAQGDGRRGSRRRQRRAARQAARRERGPLGRLLTRTAACSRRPGRRQAPFWETDGWRQVGTPLTRRAGVRHCGLPFSPDGRTLATSHDDGTVVLWDVESQQPIGSPLPGLAERWVTARFTPDGAACSRSTTTGGDPLGGRSRRLEAARLRRRGRRPHPRAVGGGRARAGLHLGLPFRVISLSPDLQERMKLPQPLRARWERV